MLFDLLFPPHEIKKNTPVLHKLVRSSLSTTEAFKKKKVFDNVMNNVTIKLKLVLAGSNLFPERGRRGTALFARDIKQLKNQNGLLRNVCLPRATLPPPLGTAES